jgi:transposase
MVSCLPTKEVGMAKKIYHVQLTAQERTHLEMYVTQGKKSARAITRARILLLSDAEHRDDDLRATLGICRQTIYNVQKRYHENTGNQILHLLQETLRPGQPVKVDRRMAAHVAMIACSEAPTGAARWTLQLLADRLVELNVVDSICLESVRKALKKPNSNPG